MTERKKAAKAIILARVSSKEQEDGYSIDAQKYRLQEYCVRKSLEILKVFEFSESSTVGNRDKFKQAIDFAKVQKDTIAVVIDKQASLLRKCFRTLPLINKLVQKNKIELHFYVENYVIHKYSTSNEKMLWNMNVVMNQSYKTAIEEMI